MISAAVLFLLLNSGVVANIDAGGVALSGAKMQWQVALIVGFAAGFLERLVPDLLEEECATVQAGRNWAGCRHGGRGIAEPRSPRLEHLAINVEYIVDHGLSIMHDAVVAHPGSFGNSERPRLRRTTDTPSPPVRRGGGRRHSAPRRARNPAP
jgi:hypothetical protein